MAADRTPNMTPANTNAEIKEALEDAARKRHGASGMNLTRSEQNMLDTAVDSMDETERRMWPPLMPR